MFDCKVLDAMRSCYQYLGEYAIPPSTIPQPGIVRYYFVCRDQDKQFEVPYASHFYDQPSHAIGHLVKPPSYEVVDGGAPFLVGVCGCCPDTKPAIPTCPCPGDSVELFMVYSTAPWGGGTVDGHCRWHKTSAEYRELEWATPEASGYSLESISYDADVDAWILHWSTPTDFVDVPVTRSNPFLCRWDTLSGGVLPPDVELGSVVFRPCGV